MNNLRIATLNVWNKNFEWEKRLPLIVKELREINPDVICLQEVLKDKIGNTAEEICSQLDGFTSYFYPEVEDTEKSSGVAILTRNNSSQSHFFRLSRYINDPKDSGNKIFGCLEFGISGNRRLFVGTTWLSISEGAQSRAVREIKFFASEQLKLEQDDVLVIAGDMNNVNENPISVLKDITSNGMVDSYQELHNGKNPETWPNSEEFFIKSWKDKHPGKDVDFDIVKRRVDYLLVSKTPGLKIISSNLFAGQPDEKGLYPSDHLGIYSDITFGSDEQSS